MCCLMVVVDAGKVLEKQSKFNQNNSQLARQEKGNLRFLIPLYEGYTLHMIVILVLYFSQFPAV